MSNSPEQSHYGEAEAYNEALKLKRIINEGVAENYTDAEKILTKEQEYQRKFQQREEMERMLSEFPPLFNEKEYSEIDPEGLLKKYYEENLKKYISEGKLIVPEFIENTPSIMSRKEADNIYDFAKKISYNGIYFENNREIAKQALYAAFREFTGKRFSKDDIKEGRYRGSHMCACNLAADLGEVANKLGAPNLADYFGKNTYCPEGPQYMHGKPENLSGSAGWPYSVGEDYPAEKIKNNILSEIKSQVKLFRAEKKR